MRLPSFIYPLLAAAATVTAEPPPHPSPSPREAALDTLLAERESLKALDAAVAEARKNGVSEQAILEARFLYHVDRREDEAIAAMLPEFLKHRDGFKLEDSAIFGVKEDWLAVIEYVQAIAALGNNDKNAFKQHITEAFWLSPRQAAAFAPHIERLRLEEAMRSVKIDFQTKFSSVVADGEVALESLVAGGKAVLLHFWSPWSRECEAAMPDFLATAATLTANGIAVASLIPGDTEKILPDARLMIGKNTGQVNGAWLVDSGKSPIARDLRVQNLPTMVLISSEGKVLFNGDPTDDAFWEALTRINPSIHRPGSPRDDDE